jgi:uncharacterized lipoprotein YddW (UPF0748 family)
MGIKTSAWGLVGVAIAGVIGSGLPLPAVAQPPEGFPTDPSQTPPHTAHEEISPSLSLAEAMLEEEQLPTRPEPSPPPRPGRRPTQVPAMPPLPPSQRLRSVPPEAPDPTAVPPSLAPGDPAEQIAPAVIDVVPTGRPPSPVVFLAMQQELKNLVGRFESALIMARSLNMPRALTVPSRPPVITAAATTVQVGGGRGAVLHPVLGEAQQLLHEWDALLAAGKHSQLRDRWLKARSALWDYVLTEKAVDQGEIRAVWLDRGTIVEARSPQGLRNIFDKLAAAGINTVFFETVNAGYPIYPSHIAPEQNPLTRGWDPLAAAVELAHQRGMTLHAWVWVFAAGNQRHNRLLNLPDSYPGPVLARHPTWAAADNHGNLIPRGQDKPFFDPANPEVRSYLTRLMTEIVTQYEVDGLHLDYIRYPFQDPGANRTYGYGEVARWRFQSVTGVDPITLTPRPSGLDRHQQIQQQVLWERWTEFRVQQVSTFVESIASTLRRHRPGLVVSAAVFANPDHDRIQRIQQDWGHWAQSNYLDWIVLMSYAADTSRFERLVSPWLVNQSFGSTLVIPGIRLLNLSSAATIDQMQASRDLPTPGYALFAATDLNTQLSTVLAQTQGNQRPTSTTPYAMAASRYTALQREWSWLLTQNRLGMERTTLDTWIAAANTLGNELDTLAQEPSRRHLDRVKASLRQVRSPLHQGVWVDTANGSYRVLSWQHRLTAIEQLLDHGAQRHP